MKPIRLPYKTLDEAIKAAEEFEIDPTITVTLHDDDCEWNRTVGGGSIDPPCACQPKFYLAPRNWRKGVQP